MRRLFFMIFLITALSNSVCFSQQNRVVITGPPELQDFMKSAAEVFKKRTGITVLIVKANPGRKGVTIGIRDLTAEVNKMPFVYTIGYDSLVLIVNKQNTINTIKADTISSIYKGKINNWESAGGNKHEIIVIEKEKGSVNKQIFAAAFSLDPGSELASSIKSGPDIQDILLIAGDPQAIGYTSRSTVRKALEKEYPVKILTIKNMSAEKTKIVHNSFIITSELLVSTGTVPFGPVKTFIDFLKGPEGQKLVEQYFYLPLTP